MKAVFKRIDLLKGSSPLTVFCKELGINYNTLKKCYQRPSLPSQKTLSKIARHYGVDLDWLLEGERPEANVDTRILANALKTLRIRKGWAIDKVAQRMNIPPRILDFFENGDCVLSQKTFIQLARELGHAPENWFEVKPPPVQLSVFPPGNTEASAGFRNEDYISIPLTQSAIAAGQPILQEENIEDYVLLHVRAAGRRGNLVASRVDGSSMEPMLHSGDIVVIDRNDKNIVKNKMYAIFYEDGLTAKYLERHKNFLILRPINPNAEVQIIDTTEHDDPVVGRIIGAWKEL